ncbi:hypothetical protein O7598_17325 [Micromonospora sp. WMMC241]|uniref:hypothetical protein n=1 Tax=Micromonospora sp. WMMC241 TaxID=3015159 RepID=UPI0022B65B84|nr:hypothetical protein [Micromonospora sp. WMMC241]MCZ7438175.1 hypothetical protein [Micromonospora sp. WMMC241]
MTPQRVLAVVLFVLAFLALAATRAFPFVDDLSGVAKSAVAVVGAACLLAGVALWMRKPPEPR